MPIRRRLSDRRNTDDGFLTKRTEIDATDFVELIAMSKYIVNFH